MHFVFPFQSVTTILVGFRSRYTRLMDKPETLTRIEAEEELGHDRETDRSV